MKISEAAKLLGISPQTLRTGLQAKVFPFGVAFKQENNTNYTYVLFPQKVYEYAGQEAKH